MVQEDSTIPVIGRIDETGMGLLRGGPSTESDQRLEDWIASNLDVTPEGQGGNHWNSLIKNLPSGPRRSRPLPDDDGRRAEGSSGWSRFHLAYRRGVTVVRLLDQNLIQQAHIEELGRDLMDLIAVGNHRLVINFTAVERLGSWIIGAVGNAHRACAAGDGGRLKLCGLDAPLAEIFEIVGMARDLEFHPGEAEALDSLWPEPSAPRSLPVDLLNVLLSLGEAPPLRGGAPVEPQAPTARPSPPDLPAASPERPSPARVALRVQAGTSEPRLIKVPAAGLTIGRDGQCPFRIGSAQVSKRHAVVEPRDHRIFVRDLGSTNGTSINGQTVRGEERELHDGDTLRIGPVTASVVIGPRGEVVESSSEWLADAEGLHHAPDDLSSPSAGPTEQDMLAFDETDPEHRIRVEVIEDVVVVTPQFEHLTDEATLALLRGKLQELYESDLPRRLVLNLEFVSQISRRAVALLLSHHIRLDWAGGALRICQAHARIMALLDQVRLTMLVDCYPTLDEGVLAHWTTSRTTLVQP